MTKIHLACFSPLPPDRSGIATYSARLFRYLSKMAKLTLFHENPKTVDAQLHGAFEIRALDSFKGQLAEQVDLCWYQMGNNISYHRGIYETAVRHPGVVTLHDLNLHAFFGETYLKEGNFAGYSREMGFAYQAEGLAHARQTYHEQSAYDVAKYPLFNRLTQGQLGIVVHNDYSLQRIRQSVPKAIIQHIPHHQQLLKDKLPSLHEAKKGLGFKPDDVVVASFGYMAPSKQIDVVLTAVAQLKNSVPNLHYLLVGQVVKGYALEAQVQQLGLESHVHFKGFVDDDAFQLALAATDIGINLRYPSLGETSGTFLSLLGAGKPTIVTNSGSFSELPADVCVKIEPDDAEITALTNAIQLLVEQSNKRTQLAQAAQEYVADVCSPEQIAQQCLAFFEVILNY